MYETKISREVTKQVMQAALRLSTKFVINKEGKCTIEDIALTDVIESHLYQTPLNFLLMEELSKKVSNVTFYTKPGLENVYGRDEDLEKNFKKVMADLAANLKELLAPLTANDKKTLSDAFTEISEKITMRTRGDFKLQVETIYKFLPKCKFLNQKSVSLLYKQMSNYLDGGETALTESMTYGFQINMSDAVKNLKL